MNSFIKKIYVMAAALLLSFVIYPTMTKAKDDEWVHSPEPYDYKNGILDDPYILNNIDTNVNPEGYDNNLGTFTEVSGLPLKFKFPTPVNIDSIYYSLVNNSRPGVWALIADGRRIELNTVNGRYNKVNIKNVVEISLTRYSSVDHVKEIDFFGSYKKDKYPKVVIKSITTNENDIVVNFEKPDDAIAVDVWLNNQKVDRITGDKYTFENLNANTEYDLMFFNYYGDDNYGEAVREKVKTKKAKLGEVEELKAEATSHNKVNLNWENPNQSNFSHVTIYRDIKKEKGLLNYLGLGLISVKAADPTKLFETNGTYFIDHSVDAATKYEYLVTTTDTDGKESKGVKTNVSTPKKPNPDPPVSEIEKQENGDYLVKWTSPKEGKILIKIDGQDYVTVDASNGSYLIPGQDMVYDWLDNPKVQIIAIDIDGDESSSTKPGPPGSTENGGSGGGGGIGGFGDLEGIQAKDVLSGTMSFIKLLGPLIILGLIIYFVPRLIRVIKQSINKQSNYNR